MRGTHQGWRDDGEVDGIIPAYAGNTRHSSGDRRAEWDHPRVCGEHTTMATWFIPFPGSSPRMRGTLSARKGVTLGNGIIPAYAGNTSTVNVSRYENGDHPRVCGEH